MNKKYSWFAVVLIVILITIALQVKDRIGHDVELNLPKDNQIVPAKTQAADPRMSFFITSVNPGKGGDLGGLAGADAYCTTLAESVGVKGKTWRAYLSAVSESSSTQGSSSVKAISARTRIGNGPWYNSKGVLVANNVNELHGSTSILGFTAPNLNKQTALTEKGEVISGRGDEVNIHDILTGSDHWGMASSTTLWGRGKMVNGTDTTCGNWTLGTDDGFAIVGHHDRIGINDSEPMKAWNSSHTTRGCSLEAFKKTGGAGLFYCFAQ
jgi:hypothetical protein